MADDNNPWQRKPDGPPDLTKLLKNLFSTKGSGANSGGTSEISGMWLWLLIGFFVLIWLLSGIFIVNQAEQAVVLTFGKYSETVGPGPHWIPQLISSEQKVDIQQIRNFQYKSEMLTEDGNIVNVSLAVQFRVDDPRQFLFSVINPGLSLQQSTASALRQTVGHMTLDAILTKGRQALSQGVFEQLNETIAGYKMGVKVTDVRLLATSPPEPVVAAFNDVINASKDRQSSINKGNTYENKVTEEAKGVIAKLTQSADAYREQVVEQARGDVARYLALLKPFQAAPAVTRERLYLDTVQEVLSQTHNVIVDSSSNNVLYLPLNQLIKEHMGASLSADQTTTAAVQSSESSNASVAEAKTRVEQLIRKGLYGSQRPSYSSGYSRGAQS